MSSAEWGAGRRRSVWAWLRRSERAASLESLSSAGSARTAVSFAFVQPPPPRRAAPAAAPARRQRRPAPALPLHVKYNLPYDAYTLPSPRRTAASRPARRAHSEAGARRAAHVPGKRPAPPPPPPPPPPPSAHEPPRRAHKRPAPRPPSYLACVDENALPEPKTCYTAHSDLMDSPPRKTRSPAGDSASSDQSAKLLQENNHDQAKLEHCVKPRPEKSFLRQIFENKFRNSVVVDSSPARVLPSISELDREAAAIIQSKRERNRRETEAIGPSIYTQTENKPSTAKNSRVEEKERLIEMLKEIKDSLPDRPKQYTTENQSAISSSSKISARKKFFMNENASSEAPTLRIGANQVSEQKKVPLKSQTSREINVATKLSEPSRDLSKNPILVTPQIIVMDSMAKDDADKHESILHHRKITSISKPAALKNVSNVYQPMKVSALFNPIYIPKNTGITTSSIDCTSEGKLGSGNSTSFCKASDVAQPTKATCYKTAVPDILKDTNANGGPIHKNNEHKNTNIDPKHCEPPLKPIAGSSNELRKPGNKATDFNLDVISQHSSRRELINKLEKSIAEGDEKAAAEAAVKLAKLRLSCSVLSFTSKVMDGVASSSKAGPHKIVAKKDSNTSDFNAVGPSNLQLLSTTTPKPNNNEKQGISIVQHNVGPSTSKNQSVDIKDAVTIQVWVEDKEASRGPIRLTVPHKANLKDLRQQAEATLGLEAKLQRWIIGNTLCSGENTSLVALAGPEFKAPFYLCLVESESTATGIKLDKVKAQGVVYTELMELEQRALVPNTDIFECEVCMEQCQPGKGVVLRECVHSFCRDCLGDVVRHSEEPMVGCPATGCPGILQEREVRGLVSSEDYERLLARGLAAAESGTRNAFHCRTPDCTGWAFCELGVRRFPCPVCKKNNCVQCKAIHDGQSCDEYRAKLEAAKSVAADKQADEGTLALLQSLIVRGEALECPECRAIITKKWGCDWIKCSACKTEICWVTRGRRWGPGGRGDTSAGCRCGVDNRRCHPACGYCH